MSEIVNAKKFFAYARERYRIKLKRDAGESWPWTDDPHLRAWRFTNIFREDDRTTKWLQKNIRGPLSDAITSREDNVGRLKLVEAVVIARWFTRISTWEIVKDLLLNEWDSREAYRRLQYVSPCFTAAFIIVGFPHQSKLNGVLQAIDQARRQLPRMVPSWETSLEQTWKDIKTIDYLGGFLAHEIVQDLNHTVILKDALDVNSWSHLGPGATRGMSWLVYNHPNGFANSSGGQKKMLELSIELLEMSRNPENWPAEFPPWKLHQVEFTLCEVAKMFRAYHGHRQKRRYEL